MKIVIQSIDHSLQRYPTVGDYFEGRDKVIHLRVSKLSNWRREMLVVVHELVEFVLTKADGITVKEIDAFDLTHPGTTEYEPGDDSEAPYYHAHQVATAVERLLCVEVGEDWNEYENEVNSLFAVKEIDHADREIFQGEREQGDEVDDQALRGKKG